MDKDLAVSLGKAARRARTARGLTQANMAEELELSVEFYGRIERGVSLPSIETFVCMLDVLDVRADDLLDIDALRAAMAESAARKAPADPPEILELVSMLREARPEVLRIVRLLLDVKEPKTKPAAGKRARRRGTRKRGRGRGRGTRKPPPDRT